MPASSTRTSPGPGSTATTTVSSTGTRSPTAAVGTNAKLGVFLDVYGVELTNDKLTFPEDQRAGLPSQQETGVFENGETTCTIDGNEEEGELKVVVWDNFTDTDDGTTYIADFDNIRLDQDQMVVVHRLRPEGHRRHACRRGRRTSRRSARSTVAS